MPTDKNLKSLQDRILAGDATAVPEFRKLLRANPAALENWSRKPTTALLARISGMMKATAIGAPLLFAEGLKSTMDYLRSSLAGPEPRALERLLTDRIICCWAQVYECDLRALSGSESAFDVRRQDSAHRRFLSACKTLAVVRKLALPLRVDVNLAGVVRTENTDQAIPPDRFRLPAGRN
jgi:hypothetical protein